MEKLDKGGIVKLSLDLEQLEVESFDTESFATWGACTGCGDYDLLDADGCCRHCFFFFYQTLSCGWFACSDNETADTCNCPTKEGDD